MKNLEKIPYTTMSYAEMQVIYEDIMNSRETGDRAETLVPYATEIKESIGGDFTLREGIEIARQDFFDEVARRFFA